MSEAEYRVAELEEVLTDLQGDQEAVNSPAWQKIMRVFRLRREFMISTIIESDDTNSATANRLKGRAQETEYYLGFMERVKNLQASTESELKELREFMKTQNEAEQGEM